MRQLKILEVSQKPKEMDIDFWHCFTNLFIFHFKFIYQDTNLIVPLKQSNEDMINEWQDNHGEVGNR